MNHRPGHSCLVFRGRRQSKRTFSLPIGNDNGSTCNYFRNVNNSICTHHHNRLLACAYSTRLCLTSSCCRPSMFQYDRGCTAAHVFVLDSVFRRRTFAARSLCHNIVCVFWLKLLLYKKRDLYLCASNGGDGNLSVHGDRLAWNHLL